MSERAPQHISRKKTPVFWDWWHENPVELITVLMFLAFFALTPWSGFGVSEQDVNAADIVIVP